MSEVKIKSRIDIDSKYKWQLEDIFESNDAWEIEFAKAQKDMKQFSKMKGTLGKSATVLFESLEQLLSFQLVIDRLFSYARMRRDEDNTNTQYQALCDRATSLMIQAGSETSFIEPEILAIDSNILDEYFKQRKELEKYHQMITLINHSRAHILKKEQERLLAMTGEISSAPSTIFSMMCDADMQFPTIKDTDGKDVQVTHGNYILMMESTDRSVRKAAFEALYTTYKSWENTIAATLSASVKKDVFYSKVRKYDSALHAALHPDNVTIDVYKNLIAAVHSALPSMYKYMDIKKRKLGVDKLHMYDLYVPLFDEGNIEVTYEQSCDMVLEALTPLGEEYMTILKQGLDSKTWIDLYENKGKTSGAYSWGVWGTHPFVLLNWNNAISEAFTLTHELGHAMHSHFSDTTQPFVNSEYPILLAEVASTCNEAIFMRYMLKKTEDKKQILFLTNYFLEQFRTTMFRQVMFAEFEMKIHDMAESGVPLTSESLSNTYRELNELYYGKEMIIDTHIDMEWARIPHFYRAFYVYKYATGFASAIALSNKILEGDISDQNQYVDFLKSGGKKFPLDLLKDAGVDLAQTDTVISALKTFTSLVDEMEKNL
ncbi:MAG: oligoendopeptidase F [Clostridiales bacterium]|nr:oligoendopeptidase F [Clostridiales bacterium]